MPCPWNSSSRPRRPTRRSLLDELHREDGQTLTAFDGPWPMTRFGVMKHLRVLEQANLVVTRRRGREKLHFLNPVPIRLVHDRWVSKYAEPWAAGLSELKHDLEGKTMEKAFEILSGLKTLLETGELLTTPGSPQYATAKQTRGPGTGRVLIRPQPAANRSPELVERRPKMLWLLLGIVLLIIAIAGGVVIHPILFVIAILALAAFFFGGSRRTV
jgi:DNA-binding transcriptional ArsR family regulator